MDAQRKAPLLPRRGARKGFPLWGKLSPQVTDEGGLREPLPSSGAQARHLLPQGRRLSRPIPPVIKTCPHSGHTNFIIYYLLFLHRPYARQLLVPPKQPPLPADTRQTGANQTYFTSSFGSKMFSKIATMAAGTMPEPPNTRRTASGVWARIPVLAPMP